MKNASNLLLLTVAALFGAPWHVSGGQNGAQPGNFDYYLLTLSWSPEYCHSHSANVQCVGGKHYGFVVHGLWPEYTRGGYPEYCSRAPGLSDPTRMLDIMPDPNLVSHEWMTHGTCSGLDANAYFDLIRRAFTSIHIPAQFAAPATQFNTSLTTLKDAFVQSNSNLSAEDIQVTCSNNYLNSVEICLRKDLTPMACPAHRNCRARTIRVPPAK